jgi:hypothetical protein
MGIQSYETLDAVSLAQLPRGPEFPRTTLVTMDLALVSGGFLSVYPGTGNAAKPFGTQSFETSLIGANWVVPFDWNHDGKIDLLTDSNSSSTPGYMADIVARQQRRHVLGRAAGLRATHRGQR